MSAPKIIAMGSDWYKSFTKVPLPFAHTKYIRADLVEKLIGYAVHDTPAGFHKGCGVFCGEPCTCGLTKLIAEIRGSDEIKMVSFMR